MSVIEILSLRKSYDSKTDVLKDVSFSIEEGELTVFVGPSGCGKTTLLKMINKLIPVSDGTIYVKGKKLSEWNTIELRRQIGYVIQQVGLMPHMTIERNIGFVPSLMKMNKELYKKDVESLTELVGLTKDILKRHPNQLSGGQAQRVGVARALAANPDIILMDEPFGAVDEITRRNLQEELKNLHKKLKKTILFVTHDIGEAIRLADKIVLFNEGMIEQIGTPKEIVFHPKSEYVKSFFGIKGFKESIDEGLLQSIYDDILNGKKTLTDLFKS